MIKEVDLLLCDEPTASLNQELANKVMDLFKEYSKEHMVILVTHDIALAEKYADRLIKIDNGTIIEDKIINKCNLFKNTTNSTNKKTFIDNIKFSFKYLLSRIGTSLFIVLFLFLILSLSFASISTFKTIKSQSDELIKFREKDNLIIINPMGLKDDSNKYILYDRFPKAKIEGLIDKVQDIIAIQMYNMEYGIYVPRNSDVSNELNITKEEMNSIIKKELDYRQNTYKLDDEFGIVISNNGSDVECLYVGENKIMNSNPFLYEGDIKNLKELNIGNYKKYNIDFYDLVNGYTPSLIYGEIPSSSDEVIITKNLANKISKYLKSNAMESLVGKTFQVGVYSNSKINECPKYLTITKDGKGNEYKHFMPNIITLKISGISPIESRDGVVFFNTGLINNSIMNEFLSNNQNYEAEKLKIYINPNSDIDKVVGEINNILRPEYSEFIKYNTINSNDDTYQSLDSLFIYLTILNIVFLITYIIFKVYSYKRNLKEDKILKIYGYNTILINITKTLVLFIISSIIFIILFYFICPYINEFAINYNYQSFIDFNIPTILLVEIIIMIVVIMINILLKG